MSKKSILSYSGKVISHLGDSVAVEADQQIIKCFLRPNLDDIVVGDNVNFSIVDPVNHTGFINALEPRTAVILRPKNKRHLKPLVSNIDQINIVIAPKPRPQEYLIDQFIITAVNSGLRYIIIVNKTDLARTKEFDEVKRIRDLYKKLGIVVIGTSCKTGSGLKRLKAHIRNKTSIFLGQSGVGKSSLMAYLTGDETIARGALTKKGESGAHTTSRAELYHLSFGGDLIDAPGIRDLGIEHFTTNQIAAGFPELAGLIGKCKFRDCSHQHEPNCAFILAKQDKKISEERFARFIEFTQ